MPSNPVDDLLARSHRHGSDPRITNYGGGNTSAKGRAVDPASGVEVDLIWVKGSGGDLGTLQTTGLAVLRRDRVQGLRAVYRGEQHEDEMVAAFDYCLHGRPTAAPSIDTSMHALVEAAHVDHLHPDDAIAIATSADGESLTAKVFGDRVLWVPWRRPGFQLGLDIARLAADNPQAIGCVLGGHGISAWGATSEECEANSLEIIDTATRYIREHGRPDPLGPVRAGFEALPAVERHRRASALVGVIRSLASTDERMVGHYDDSPVVLDFMARASAARLSAAGTSCPDHFLRTKVTPLLLDVPATTPVDAAAARLRELHVRYREEYAAYYQRHATPSAPPMRGADPRIVLVPGVGMFSFGADAQTARVAGEYFVNAINAMTGAESVSTYSPIPESEKFRVEYWELEEAKLRRRPPAKPLAGRIALVTGGASGIGRAVAQRLSAEGACVVVADLDVEAARSLAEELGGPDRAVALQADVGDEASIMRLVQDAATAFCGLDLVVNNAGLVVQKSLLDTTVEDWDLLHDVMARGSFLVTREAARLMIEQGLGGDIVYISSKNSVFAGPKNIAYSAAKADQAHQVRLLAAELGEHGIRVNGINPDGVVRGSGMFRGDWGADRAATYGVELAELGEFYAQRTLLKREVLPDDVAGAVVAVTAGDLSKTTGLHIPVDSGVAAAFLR
jgi:rhamnulose-1-phosphate aldolase/alcohol dehydrogenase